MRKFDLNIVGIEKIVKPVPISGCLYRYLYWFTKTLKEIDNTLIIGETLLSQYVPILVYHRDYRIPPMQIQTRIYHPYLLPVYSTQEGRLFHDIR